MAWPRLVTSEPSGTGPVARARETFAMAREGRKPDREPPRSGLGSRSVDRFAQLAIGDLGRDREEPVSPRLATDQVRDGVVEDGRADSGRPQQELAIGSAGQGAAVVADTALVGRSRRPLG